MLIKVAKSAGFCFGVARAVKQLEELIQSSDKNIYCVGKLIHNPSFNRSLEARGIIFAEADQTEIVPEDSIAVLRTHGVPLNTEQKLSDRGCEVRDLTCPFVKNIHNIMISQTDTDTLSIIIGDEKHPEIEGIKSRAHGDAVVFSGFSELEKHIYNLNTDKLYKKIIAVVQTTHDVSDWQMCQNIIKKVYTNALIFDTICNVTYKRQHETEELAGQCDTMLVIGGRDSSNTAKLYDICKKNCNNSYWIETADELPRINFKKSFMVGITAGASTPDGIIEEVLNLMSEQIQNEAEMSFEEMLEQSFKTLNTRDKVTGVVTSVSANEVHVDLGTKHTGILPYDEATDDPSADLNDLYKVGDRIEVIATRVSDLDGVATLSKKRVDAINNWQNIVQAHEDGSTLNGKIVEAVKSGVIASVDSVRVFVPASQTGLPREADLQTMVGQKVKVKIIDINEERHRAVASVRQAVREDRREKEANIWNGIEVGKKYDGIVKSFTSYGAFVDLGGVDGMIHITELSWKRIKHPSEAVSIGDKVEVYVKDFDFEKKRISLGYRKDEDNPWSIFINTFNPGDVTDAKIISMMPFGAFAEIIPGVDGLIHISQIDTQKIQKPSDVLSTGEIVKVKITDINYDTRKVSLSIKVLLQEEQDAADEYAADGEDSLVVSDNNVVDPSPDDQE
ncbi:MAG: bifunctional 4-hydroxy-3-methylbut-2-enyl diphosphate reductase/30S ribosomal protein S1 [Eubacteriales bacterium]